MVRCSLISKSKHTDEGKEEKKKKAGGLMDTGTCPSLYIYKYK
jgi:hypothetical protein